MAKSDKDYLNPVIDADQTPVAHAKAQLLKAAKLKAAIQWGSTALAVTGIVALGSLPFLGAGLLTLNFIPALVLASSVLTAVLGSAVLGFMQKPTMTTKTTSEAPVQPQASELQDQLRAANKTIGTLQLQVSTADAKLATAHTNNNKSDLIIHTLEQKLIVKESELKQVNAQLQAVNKDKGHGTELQTGLQTMRSAEADSQVASHKLPPVVLDFDKTFFPKHLHNRMNAEFFPAPSKPDPVYDCPKVNQYRTEAQAEAWLKTPEGQTWLTDIVIPGEVADHEAYLADAKSFYNELKAQGREVYIASHTSYRTALLGVLNHIELEIPDSNIHVYGQIVATHTATGTSAPKRDAGKAMYLAPLNIQGPAALIDDSGTNIRKWPHADLAFKFNPVEISTRPFNCVRIQLGLTLQPEQTVSVGIADAVLATTQQPLVLIAGQQQWPVIDRDETEASLSRERSSSTTPSLD